MLSAKIYFLQAHLNIVVKTGSSHKSVQNIILDYPVKPGNDEWWIARISRSEPSCSESPPPVTPETDQGRVMTGEGGPHQEALGN